MNENIAIFSCTNPSFLGLESDPIHPIQSPKTEGFEDRDTIATYAHESLENRLGFDIIELVDGTLVNTPEQPVIVLDKNGNRIDAIGLIRRQSIGYLDGANRYTLYVIIPEDLEKTKQYWKDSI